MGCPETWNAVHWKQLLFFNKVWSNYYLLNPEIKFSKCNHPIVTSIHYTTQTRILSLPQAPHQDIYDEVQLKHLLKLKIIRTTFISFTLRLLYFRENSRTWECPKAGLNAVSKRDIPSPANSQILVNQPSASLLTNFTRHDSFSESLLLYVTSLKS